MQVATWKVGELARRSGLSVRTLHYYDEIGLLKPCRRTASGHRLYSAGDAARLQQIISLQQLGLSLREVRECLGRPRLSLLRVLQLQLDRLETTIALQEQLRQRLARLVTRLQAAQEVTISEFAATMEVISKMDQVKKHFTPEQLEQLEQRKEELGEERIRGAEAEWPELIAQVRAEMERGSDPADERVQRLAQRWRELTEAFTGGDSGIGQAVATMYRQEEGLARQQGLDPEIFAYVGAALEAAGSSE